MSTKQRYCLRVLVGIISATAALPAAFALDITLPAETAAYKPSELPGYRLVQQNWRRLRTELQAYAALRGRTDSRRALSRYAARAAAREDSSSAESSAPFSTSASSCRS